MIQPFIDKFMANRESLLQKYSKNQPADYAEIVKDVVSIVSDPEEYGSPDPNRITEIDHGDYQGTLLFIIAARGYQPDTFWSVKVSYGSCSGCDTLERIRGYSDEPPTADQVRDYMTLALHVVQAIAAIGEGDA